MIYRNMQLNTLSQILSTIEDPRDERGKKHRLIDIFLLTIYGSLWGHTDFTNMCIELKYRESFFVELLGLPHGIPSHDTFSAVFSIIEPTIFLEGVLSWLAYHAKSRGYQVAIDGKAIRAACDKVHRGKVPYVVNAFVIETGLCIGQIRIDEKTNEITGIPELLEWLDIEGATITIDAIGCQRAIAEKIIQKGADFILSVKENQATLHSDILLEMQTQIAQKELMVELAKEQSKKRKEKVAPVLNENWDEFVQTNKGHGRIERRHYYVLNDASCVDKELWPHVKSIALVKRERQVIHRDEKNEILDEEATCEFQTYIMSRPMWAEEFAGYVRGHWGIENSLHWVLDDYFREDRCTARVEHATENLALLRKLVFDLMVLDPHTKGMSKKAKQIYYRNDDQAVIRLLFDSCDSRA